jgi:hypothetical protein
LFGGKVVYLDQNIFADIRRRRQGVSPRDEDRLRTLIDANDVVIPLSHSILQETAELYRKNPEGGIGELRWVVSLTTARNNLGAVKIVKYPGSLVNDDITAYARNQEHPSAYETVDLRPLLSPSSSDHPYFMEMIDLSDKHKRDFLQWGKGVRQDLLPKDEQGRIISHNIQLEPDARRSFDEYLNEHMEAFVDDLAWRADVQDLVRARGIAGLLNESRAVLLSVGASLSLFYAGIIEDRAPDKGDFFDYHHAVSASPADIFVTGEKELVRKLSRVPISKFEVWTPEKFWDRVHERSATLTKVP